MTILDAPPPGWKRPSLGLKAKLDLMVKRYGHHQYHHVEGYALWERKFDTGANDTIPPCNDLRFLEAVTVQEHDVIENGPGAEKRITSAGSQTNRRAKARRISDNPERWRQLLGPKPEKRDPPSRWAKRKMRTGRRRP